MNKKAKWSAMTGPTLVRTQGEKSCHEPGVVMEKPYKCTYCEGNPYKTYRREALRMYQMWRTRMTQRNNLKLLNHQEVHSSCD